MQTHEIYNFILWIFIFWNHCTERIWKFVNSSSKKINPKATTVYFWFPSNTSNRIWFESDNKYSYCSSHAPPSKNKRNVCNSSVKLGGVGQDPRLILFRYLLWLLAYDSKLKTQFCLIQDHVNSKHRWEVMEGWGRKSTIGEDWVGTQYRLDWW